MADSEEKNNTFNTQYYDKYVIVIGITHWIIIYVIIE